MTYDDLTSLASSLRLKVLEMIDRAQMGDVAYSLAAVDALVALYFGKDNEKRILNVNVAKPKSDDRDYVVLSHGAAAPALYACLGKAGFFDESELNHYGKDRALLKQFPDMKIPGVDAPVVAPGQGMAIGEGIARGLSLDKKSNHVFVVLDDEDLKCGQTWEAMMRVTFDRLSNVTLVCCYAGSKKVAPVQEKLKAFGWEVSHLVNGHDMKELVLALAHAKEKPRKPVCVLVPTVLSKGVPFAEGKLVYRGALFSKQEMELAVSSLSSKS
jgi:transketolase